MPSTLLSPSRWPQPLAGWWNGLRYRPLLWMALAALAGVALGAQWAELSRAVQRDDAWLLWPLLLSLIFGVLAWLYRGHELLSRVALAGAITGCFACYTARQMLPPPGDVSFLVFESQPPKGPFQPHFVEVEGTVADYPRRGDFYTQFPLQCQSPYTGRLWLRVPFGTAVEIGDEMRARVQVRQLERPGNPAERAVYLSSIGADCWASARVKAAKDVLWIKPGAQYAVERRIAGWRRALLARYERAFAANPERPYPRLSAQLMTAVVFGEGGLSEPLPRAEREDFRAAGMSHILVASGTQITFLGGALLLLARGAGIRRWPLLLLIIPALVFYALLVGGAASIWRATGAGILVTIGLLLGRQVDGLSLWSAAMLVLLALDPVLAWSLSFQLTFAATWGLLVLTPALKRWIETVFAPSGVNDALALTFGAQGATLPFTLYHFGTLSIVGLGANLFAVPLAAFLLGNGTLGLLIGPLNVISYHVVNGLSSLAHTSALQAGAAWEGQPVALLPLLLVGVFAFALTPSSEDRALLRELASERFEKWRNSWAGRFREPRQLIGMGVGALFFCCLGICWFFSSRGDGQLHVTMLDVGQGEAILIQTPAGRAMLIDGGTLEAGARSDIGRAVIVPELRRRGIKHLEMLAVTHADADHCSGLAAVVREIPVGVFLDGPAATHPSPTAVDYGALRKELEARGVKRTIPAAGQFYDLDGAKLTILAPTGPAFEGDNNNAIVAMLEFGQTRVLLTADIEQLAEERLLRSYPDLRCNVLKVGHHGSATSTSEEWLQATQPQAALISCGKYNPFGHPKAEVLQRLNDKNVPVFRTDANGAIDVTCSRESCGVQTFK